MNKNSERKNIILYFFLTCEGATPLSLLNILFLEIIQKIRYKIYKKKWKPLNTFIFYRSERCILSKNLKHIHFWEKDYISKTRISWNR